ncbi:MAG: RNA polymerase sigma factor region1.1 domain-containing protein, partial [Hylemonella sp.]|nr:RNA polymerase sigma factor region1.1 domain-containing protein [Hylemonella sp.]
MPAQKSKKPAKPAAKPVAKASPKPVAKKAAAPKAVAKPAAKALPKPATKVPSVPASKTPVKAAKTPAVEVKKTVAVATEEVVKKKPGRPPKAASADGTAPKTGAKRGRKPKSAAGSAPSEDLDLSDIEAEFAEEPAVAPGEKVKPLRMKISKAKERALMKEFGLDETVLSEEDLAKRRQRLKQLIKLGKTRGYLTHGEISDHLPDKLVDAETLEVVISMLNDMGVAVYEQTPDAETLLLNNTAPTAATEEEAEEEAEAALSTVDSEFGRTTDPVRMYMREMGTVELLTREGEIEIAKRIEEGLRHMVLAISACPTTIIEILDMANKVAMDAIRIDEVIDGLLYPSAPNEDIDAKANDE